MRRINKSRADTETKEANEIKRREESPNQELTRKPVLILRRDYESMLHMGTKIAI
jgi:hypothetical protein